MAAAYKIIPGIVKVINISGQMKGYEFSFTEQPGKTQSATDPLPAIPQAIESVEFKQVDFKYDEQHVLNNFSFNISKGDFFVITGESGKGKTTLLHLLLGFLQPAGGDILINGIAMNTDGIKDHWPSIAYVRQQKFLINDSLLRNITLEEEGFNKKDLQRAVDISGLEKLMVKFPEGLDKIITENGKNISGGQQQRIAIARALYKNSSLLLFDEPFNELDEESTISLLEHFQALSETGKMIVLITHDKRSLSYCNKTISLDQS